MPDLPMYTVLTVIAMAIAVAIDLWGLRTRLVLKPVFWMSLAIMMFFQVFVDGWLTRSDQTIVRYNPEANLEARVFFNTPIEDFGYGFALILLTLAIWHRLTRPTNALAKEQKPPMTRSAQ